MKGQLLYFKYIQCIGKKEILETQESRKVYVVGIILV